VQISEQYGEYTLSIVASSYHYSEPRIDDLPQDQYRRVEVALVRNGKLVNPRRVKGFPKSLANLWEKGHNPVAGYLTWGQVNAIREALKTLG
jgi:hypothetical protein